jgi:hypothetical protein
VEEKPKMAAKQFEIVIIIIIIIIEHTNLYPKVSGLSR